MDRKALVKACAAKGIVVSSKDSTKRLKEKLARGASAPESPAPESPQKLARAPARGASALESHRAAPASPRPAPASPRAAPASYRAAPASHRAAPLDRWRRSYWLVLLVPVVAALLTQRKPQTPRLEFDDPEIQGFVRSWESPRRKNAASLVLVANASVVRRVFDSLSRGQKTLRAPDVTPEAFRRFLKKGGGLVLVENVSHVAHAETAIDPYLNAPLRIDDVFVDLSKSAVVFAFAPPSCDKSARELFKDRFPLIPTAFHNRVQYATVVC